MMERPQQLVHSRRLLTYACEQSRKRDCLRRSGAASAGVLLLVRAHLLVALKKNMAWMRACETRNPPVVFFYMFHWLESAQDIITALSRRCSVVDDARPI
jgi:hypothetical protein